MVSSTKTESGHRIMLPKATPGQAYWLTCTLCGGTTIPTTDEEYAQTTGYGLGWRLVTMPNRITTCTICPECLKLPISSMAEDDHA